MKPHIKAHYSQPSCNRKWQCITVEYAQCEGRQYDRIGTGYSPMAAYAKWLRHGRDYKRTLK
jgi:hypothetical protein